MSSQYPFTTSSTSYDPTALQPLLSTLAQVLLLVAFLFYLSSNQLRNFLELFKMGLNSILSGKAFGKVDWGVTADQGMNGGASGGEKGKGIRRRYADTKEGREAWESGNLHFPGLLNAAGNLCFLNATLQSMASLPSLLSYLDELLTTSESFSYSLPVASALYTTLTALNTPSTSSRPPPLRPLLLASALADSSESRRRLLSSSDQQDAHELWGMIRDAVEEESIKLGKYAQLQHSLKNGNGLKEVEKLRRNGFSIGIEGLGKEGERKKRSGKNDPWFWLRSQKIKCMQCGYVRDTRHEGEELLMLNVPPVSSCSLYDLLHEYTKADLLSDYACRKCSMLATLDKYTTQRDRLAGLIPPSQPPPVSSLLNSKHDFDIPQAETKKDTKMTSSRKDRKRKIGKLVDRLQAVVDSGDYEKDLTLGSEYDGIKMERTGSAAGKTVNMARTPEVLLIHLNRSTHYGYSGPIKNSCQVTFPEYLDLNPFSDNPSPPSESSSWTTTTNTKDLYRLSSLVVHYGSHSFGHYVAFRRRPNPPPSSSTSEDAGSLSRIKVNPKLPEWYRISDETVDVSTIDEALRNNPFLLFYERLEDNGRRQEREGEGEGKTLQEMLDGLRPRVVESWRARSQAKGTDPVQRSGNGVRDEAEVPPEMAEAEDGKEEEGGGAVASSSAS